MKYFSKISPAKILLISAIIIGFILRVFMLDKIPQGFNWDEASVSYNAYSLSETGKDEFGKSWPLIIESFGDYKTGIYSILLAPIIKIFGFSIFIARIPNVFVGLAVILASYYLALAFFKNKLPASLVALLISISPWAVHTSRFVLEWHPGIPLAIIGGYFLLTSKKNSINIVWAAILLSLSMYFYHSLRLFAPLLGLSYILINSSWAIKQRKMIFFATLAALITLIPLLITAKSTNLLSRPSAVSIFSDSNTEEANEGIYRETITKTPWFRIYNNSTVVISKKFISRYLSHFSPQFLFLGEDASPRLGIDGVGKLYLTSLPFMLIGVVTLLQRRNNKDLFLLSWLLLAPLASSLTKDSPHALRSLIFLPTFQVLTASGILVFYRWLKNKKIKKIKLITATIAASYLFGLGFFLNRYFLFYPEDTAPYWQDGYKEMVEAVNIHESSFDRVFVSKSYGQPHIFFALFTPISPDVYQSEVINQVESFNSRISQLGKISFLPIEKSLLCEENSLVVSAGEIDSSNLPKI